ncbi:Fis family transcriptional regulator [Parazoarcus communis]|uniref:Fis family transcriptional regulator n=1 Tax=Parazoarcus communis TaxID=41977 RepID=A0A2U8GPG6_9RHOO|nr:GAF domain-containing protein [Parazoarcus communis]AWI75378.1 Fis family transcriptional regulator [Parazoarcus communis]
MNKASSSVALPPDLRASWLRSQAHGLQTDQPLPLDPLNRADLADRLESNARLVTFSQPVIENLLRQIDSRDATVLLTDNQGLILSANGDTGFLDRAARVALGPGAAWSEEAMGTNAIGTALATGDIIAVRGHEHFLERNRFLTCVAIPILAPTGGIAGILDISTDANANLSHSNALLRTTAEIIEHRLVESMDDGFLRVRFHNRPELLGSPLEAIAVFDEGGRVMACNRNARNLLRLHQEYPDASCEDCFAITWQRLLDWAALDQSLPFPLRARQGQTLAARVSLHRRPLDFSHGRTHGKTGTPGAGNPPAANADSVVAVTRSTPSGDPRVIAATTQIRRWASGKGPLLIEGETGTGKHYLASTLWHEHAPGTALIQMDCRALASSTDIGAELAVAMRQARGGALYLSDIDALPLSWQGSLFADTAHLSPRLVAATRRNLDVLVDENRLNMSAFAASHGTEVHLPPLRRRSDFDSLVRGFVRGECPDRPMYVCPDALALLRKHRWPGNLSELHNRLRLILALMGDEAGQLCPDDIPEELLEQIGD